MSEEEVGEVIRQAKSSLPHEEFVFMNNAPAQQQCRRELRIAHYVDDNGEDGNVRGLLMPARICAHPKCRRVLPYAWPTVCHPCGFYVVLARVGPNGRPSYSNTRRAPEGLS